MTTNEAKCLVCHKTFNRDYWYSFPSCFGTGKNNLRRKIAKRGKK